MITLGEALKNSSEALLEFSDSPNLDALTLLADRIGESRAWILAHPEVKLAESTKQLIQSDIAQLKNGMPLPYVVGHWEFYGLDFTVNQNTLIPRPETELLVEHALSWIDHHPDRRWVADVGTGSGCIAITLAKIQPSLSLIALDLSFLALKVARENAFRHNVSNQVNFIQSNLLDPLVQPFDIICANLPYIPSDLLPSLEVAKKEPKLALNGGQDGFDVISRFLGGASEKIAPGGCVLFEIEQSQCPQVQKIAQQLFPLAEITVHKDLAGLDRLISIQLPEDNGIY
ncbi:MAG: peptide chain release factor N(5)-glutamine methyltransferase [Anaerolineales bacterium]